MKKLINLCIIRAMETLRPSTANYFATEPRSTLNDDSTFVRLSPQQSSEAFSNKIKMGEFSISGNPADIEWIQSCVLTSEVPDTNSIPFGEVKLKDPYLYESGREVVLHGNPFDIAAYISERLYELDFSDFDSVLGLENLQ